MVIDAQHGSLGNGNHPWRRGDRRRGLILSRPDQEQSMTFLRHAEIRRIQDLITLLVGKAISDLLEL
jgi:hypothetical protein